MAFTSGMRFCKRGVLCMCTALLVAAHGSGAAQQSCTLPPIQDLLMRSDKVSVESDRKLGTYDWIVIRNANIATSQREGQPAEVYLSYAVNGVRVERMFLENGSSLTVERQKRVEKDVARALARHQQPSSSPAAMLGSDAVFLRAGAFTDGRCGSSGSRRIFIFHYRGNPETKGLTADEKVASHLSGTMSFDADEGSANTGDLRLDTDVRMAVVFKLKKGLVMHMTNTRVAPGVWYSTDVSFTGGVRMFFNGASMTMQEHALHFVQSSSHSEDPYRGMSFGSLSPDVRAAMMDGLENTLRYPVPDETE